mmetsp:Transcript_3601/g.7284  ORF Transcript_3601/g.7284 Transcript_3601/m.7284 type:complete len:89 (-) Transcript_3601:45-311(-)
MACLLPNSQQMFLPSWKMSFLIKQVKQFSSNTTNNAGPHQIFPLCKNCENGRSLNTGDFAPYTVLATDIEFPNVITIPSATSSTWTAV